MVSGEDLIDVLMVSEMRLRKLGNARMADAINAAIKSFCISAGVEQRPFVVDTHQLERVEFMEKHGLSDLTVCNTNDFLAEVFVCLLEQSRTP